ncbi:MAG TPA: hypothetical protein VH595_21655 [Verrucomicrobiae bacterium]|nr:hypothetical protein [Verrucomicrobiae bacterium]
MAIEEMKNFMESNETKMKKEEAGKSREGAHLSVKPVKAGQTTFKEPAFCAESAENPVIEGVKLRKTSNPRLYWKPATLSQAEEICLMGFEKFRFAFWRCSVMFSVPLDVASGVKRLQAIPVWGWAAIITLNIIPCSAGWFLPD